MIVFAIFVEFGFADDAAAFNAPVILSNRERIFFADFRDLDALDRLSIRDHEMWCGRGSEKISVESWNVAGRRKVRRIIAAVRQWTERGDAAAVAKRNAD